jgi:hypothetical protein
MRKPAACLAGRTVATRALTSKSVVYRRWRTPPELVLAAMRQRGPLLSGEPPNTGSLRGDVLALLTCISARLEEVGPEVILGLVADYVRDAELLAHLRPEVLSVGLEVMWHLLSRSAERGEIPTAEVPPRVASLPVDLLRHELFVTQRSVPESARIAIVDEIFLPLVHRAEASD